MKEKVLTHSLSHSPHSPDLFQSAKNDNDARRRPKPLLRNVNSIIVITFVITIHEMISRYRVINSSSSLLNLK